MSALYEVPLIYFNECRSNKLSASNSSSSSVSSVGEIVDFSQTDVGTITLKTSFNSNTNINISTDNGVKVRKNNKNK